MATSRPRTMGTIEGWLGTITVRTVVNHFRLHAVDKKWLVPNVAVDELPPDEPHGPLEPEWLVTKWLAPRIAGDPRLQETYELLRYKAETDKTLAQVPSLSRARPAPTAAYDCADARTSESGISPTSPRSISDL